MGNYVSLHGEVGIGPDAFHRLTEYHTSPILLPRSAESDDSKRGRLLSRSSRWSYDARKHRFAFTIGGKLWQQHVDDFLHTLAHLKHEDTLDIVEYDDDFATGICALRADRIGTAMRYDDDDEGDDDDGEEPVARQRPTVEDIYHWTVVGPPLIEVRDEDGPDGWSLRCTTLRGTSFTTPAAALGEGSIYRDRSELARVELDGSHTLRLVSRDDAKHACHGSNELHRHRLRDESEREPPATARLRVQAAIRLDPDSYELFDTLVPRRPRPAGPFDHHADIETRFYDEPRSTAHLYMPDVSGAELLELVDTLATLLFEDAFELVEVTGDAIDGAWLVRAGRRMSGERMWNKGICIRNLDGAVIERAYERRTDADAWQPITPRKK